MLRKFAGAFLVVFGLALSSTAWAITATVTGQGTGTAVKGGTLTLVKQTPKGTVTRHSGRINPTTHTATVPVNVKKDDKLYASLDGGLTGKPVTEEQLTGGVPIDFSTGVGPIPQPTPTYSQTPYMPPVPVRVYDWNGFYIGGGGSFSNFDQRITEHPTGTDIISNRLLDTKGMGGFSINAGYDFGGLGVPGVTIGPTGSFNYFGQSNNHLFSGEFFLGTKTIWTADLGGKIAFWGPDRRTSIYGLAGLELANFDLQSNFTGPIISVNRTATGWFAGAGVEYAPGWRMGDGQWTTFGQLTFSEICGDLVRMPPFSSSFDYSTHFTQVRATVGFNFRPGGP